MQRRKIETHKTNDCNSQIEIAATGEPGPGGASHRYSIWGFDTTTNLSRSSEPGNYDYMNSLTLLFQNGPIPEKGVNGITMEVLLAVVIDRLEGFQAGEFTNIHNQRALAGCKMALNALKDRTEERTQRGVEGKLEP